MRRLPKEGQPRKGSTSPNCGSGLIGERFVAAPWTAEKFPGALAATALWLPDKDEAICGSTAPGPWDLNKGQSKSDSPGRTAQPLPRQAGPKELGPGRWEQNRRLGLPYLPDEGPVEPLAASLGEGTEDEGGGNRLCQLLLDYCAQFSHRDVSRGKEQLTQETTGCLTVGDCGKKSVWKEEWQEITEILLNWTEERCSRNQRCPNIESELLITAHRC
ncbi:uncharacterized protein LOC121036650 [Herpailurus yagouaroundi]|uniref:uncharacterized protein LOC121036650 n=1 Tax=Herpailurus yagouaroundi TaxID=1608482 RepID=UPI001AD66E00|nr:uncharacterized protein LOC121036650 [Puma yagouaroundi]